MWALIPISTKITPHSHGFAPRPTTLLPVRRSTIFCHARSALRSRSLRFWFALPRFRLHSRSAHMHSHVLLSACLPREAVVPLVRHRGAVQGRNNIFYLFIACHDVTDAMLCKQTAEVSWKVVKKELIVISCKAGCRLKLCCTSEASKSY